MTNEEKIAHNEQQSKIMRARRTALSPQKHESHLEAKRRAYEDMDSFRGNQDSAWVSNRKREAGGARCQQHQEHADEENVGAAHEALNTEDGLKIECQTKPENRGPQKYASSEAFTPSGAEECYMDLSACGAIECRRESFCRHARRTIQTMKSHKNIPAAERSNEQI